MQKRSGDRRGRVRESSGKVGRQGIGPASTAVTTSEENGIDRVKILGIAVYNARIYVDIFIGIFMYL